MAFKLLFLSCVMAFIAITMSASVDFNRNSADFSIELYNKVINAKPNENVIISPLSIQTAVSLAYMGAKGITADEMVKGLHLGTNEKSTVGTNFQKVLDTYKDSSILKLANKIYIKDGFQVKPEFNNIAKTQFHSDAENIDFERKEQAASTINSWVENKTNQKIKDLLSPSIFTNYTRMVLVNAIYFKGDWVKKFNEAKTFKTDFHTNPTDSVQVQMMSNENTFKYGYFDDLGASALEMDYKDSDLSMIFILPNEINGLSALEEKLLTKNLLDISNEMYINPVNVQIPKFRIESSVDLKEVLKSMGMENMFSDEANFEDLLVSAERLTISDVLHKAFVEVNEEGAEAAGATGVVISNTRASIPQFEVKTFHADHPFYFAIKSKSQILFSGKYIK